MIKQKVILITGTSSGIGNYLTKYYLTNNNIVVGCSRKKISFDSKNYFHFTGDVSNENLVKEIFNFIKKNFGKLDVLINNAGLASMNHSLLTPSIVIEKLFNTNLKGTFLFSIEAAKIMKKNKFGRIVNFTSVAVPLKIEGEAIYSSSKAAVLNLTYSLSKELASFGITVNAIGPNPINTKLISSVPKEKINKLIESQAIKRFGEFEDISNIIDFYIKPESNFITGQVLYLGGI